MTFLKLVARRVLPARFWTRLRLLRMRHEINRYPAHDVCHCYGCVRPASQKSKVEACLATT